MTSLLNGKISIDQVVNSLNAFKHAIYNVNYVNKLIIQNTSSIITAGEYASVISSYIINKYPTNSVDIGIANIPLDKTKWTEGIFYYQSLHSNWNNQPLTTANNFDDTKSYNLINESMNTCSDYLNKVLEKNSTSKKIYQFYIKNWLNGLQLVCRCFQPDILDETKWITVTCGMNLTDYFPDANNLSTFYPEYITFVNMISQLILDLESANWNNTDLIQNIWEYSNLSNIDNTVCLYSGQFPSWNNQLISNCFIPNSNTNVQHIMTQLFNDIYLYYPLLSFGEIAFSSYNINGNNILSVCKIDTYNGKQCIKEVKINLQLFYNQNNIVGDTIFNGNILLKNEANVSIIQTDIVTKEISINSKIGINQGLGKINGLLDIDNLSNTDIMKIVTTISALNNNSYIIVNDISNSLISNPETFTASLIPPDYMEDIIVFSCPIYNRIQPTDITFLYNPPNIFNTTQFSNESFLKIQTIVNEINKMSHETNEYYIQERKLLTMSFVEILNDTEYNYLCSIKTILANNNVYFVASISLVQSIMINPNYKNIFVNLINQFSSLNRLLNYSILVIELPEIYSQLLLGNSVDSFTKYVQAGEFSDRFGLTNDPQVLCIEHFTGNTLDKNNIGRLLFTEQYPERAGKYLKDVFLKNSDRTCADVTFEALSYYQNTYSLNKVNQNFIIHYIFDSGEKITFTNKIKIHDTEYTIGVGINVEDCIDQSILSAGDNQMTGSLIIKDDLKTNIFEVNTEYKKIVNMYNTGFGTNNPKTIIDVNDSGLTDIINFIKDYAMLENTININIGYIKNLSVIDASNVDTCINTNFIDPKTGTQFIQTHNNYFFASNAPIDDNPDDLYNIYNWLYPKWSDEYFTQINDPNNKEILTTAINNWLNTYKSQYIFDGTQSILSYSWIFGQKFAANRIFKSTNNTLITFASGLNIGNYNMKYNNNGNISKFFDNMTYMNLYLQNFIIRYNTIDTTTISNYLSLSDYFIDITQSIPITNFKLTQIIVDFSNYNNAIVYDIDFNTFAISGNPLNQTISNLKDINKSNKYYFMMQNIHNTYSLSNSNPQLFNKGDYGIINFEDDYVDFVNIFYCSEVTSTSVTLISLEVQINTIIKPSVNIVGDCKISGDTYFHDNNTNTDFVSIDTHEQFMGIGTNKRYSYYNINYNNTTNGQLARNHFIVSGNTFPLAVFERYSEIIPTRDPSSNNIIEYPDDKISLFTNKSALSARRASREYSIDEMKNMASQYSTTLINGPYKGQTKNNYKYGPDISFVIKDNATLSREIGNIHMVIDDIKDNNILAGFGITVVDNSPNGDNNEREIMYINNNGNMNVDQITLGMDTDISSNNILLSASNNDLLINNTSLTELINTQINSMFSIDASSGNLSVTLNGVTKQYAPI
jgi:hypothetical protein